MRALQNTTPPPLRSQRSSSRACRLEVHANQSHLGMPGIKQAMTFRACLSCVTKSSKASGRWRIRASDNESLRGCLQWSAQRIPHHLRWRCFCKTLKAQLQWVLCPRACGVWQPSSICSWCRWHMMDYISSLLLTSLVTSCSKSVRMCQK